VLLYTEAAGNFRPHFCPDLGLGAEAVGAVGDEKGDILLPHTTLAQFLQHQRENAGRRSRTGMVVQQDDHGFAPADQCPQRRGAQRRGQRPGDFAFGVRAGRDRLR
jgi:hypothetical protein